MEAIYISANQFSVVGDKTSDFIAGRRIRANCNIDGYKYSTIQSSIYSAPNTVVTIEDSELTSNLIEVHYGLVSQGSTGSLPVHTHDGSEGHGGTISYNDLTNIPTIPQSFTDLDDTPANYTSAENKFLKVVSGEVVFEHSPVWYTLNEAPSSILGKEGDYCYDNSTGDIYTKLDWVEDSGTPILTRDLGSFNDGAAGGTIVGAPTDSNTYYTFDGTDDGVVYGEYSGDEGSLDIKIRARFHNLSKNDFQCLWKAGGSTQGIYVGLNNLNALGIFGRLDESVESITIPSTQLSENVWYTIYAAKDRITIINEDTEEIINQTGTAVGVGDGSADESVGYSAESSPANGTSGVELTDSFFEGDIDYVLVYSAGDLDFPSLTGASWQKVGNVEATYYGNGVPTLSGTHVKNSDKYLDVDTGNQYEVTDGSWSKIFDFSETTTSVSGIIVNSTMWYSGIGWPTGTEGGKLGDYYVNDVNKDVWRRNPGWTENSSAPILSRDLGSNDGGLSGGTAYNSPTDNGDYYTFLSTSSQYIGYGSGDMGDEGAIDVKARFRIHNKNLGQEQCIWKSGGATHGFEIGIDSSGNLGAFCRYDNSLTSIVTPISTYAENVWYVIYASKTRVSILEDGTSNVIELTGSMVAGNGNGEEVIGGATDTTPVDSGGPYFNGDIDYVYIYNEGDLDFPSFGGGNSQWEFFGSLADYTTISGITVSGIGVSTFLELTDTPNNYYDALGKYLRVTEDGIGFSTLNLDAVETDYYGWELVEEWTVVSGNMNTTLSGIQGDTYDEWLFTYHFHNAGEGDAGVYFELNGDSTSGNYYSSTISQRSDGIHARDEEPRSNMLVAYSYSDPNSHTSGRTTVFLKSGTRRASQSIEARSAGAQYTNANFTCSWTNTVDEVTSMRVYTSNSIDGYIKLYRKVPMSFPYVSVSGGGSSNVQTFLDLIDTPSSYSVGKYLQSTASGIEFVDLSDIPGLTTSGTQLHMAKMRCTTDLSVPNATDTRVPFDVTIFDVGGIADPTTDKRIDIIQDGKYLINASTERTFLAANEDILAIKIAKNGVIGDVISKRAADSTSVESLQISTVLECVSGDYIDVYLYHEAGTTETFDLDTFPVNLSVIQLAEYSGGGSSVQRFLELIDTPTTYSGSIGKYLQVTASGIEFAEVTGGGSSDVQTFLDLADTPTTYSGVIGKYLQATASGLEFISPEFTSSPSTFEAYELLAEIDTSTTTETDIDIDEDDIIIIEGINVYNSVNMRPNNDTGNNYDWGYYSQDGTSFVGGSQTGINYFDLIPGGLESAAFSAKFFPKKTGNRRALISSVARYDTANTNKLAQSLRGFWTDTTSTVTSIRINNAVGTGIVKVYRLGQINVPITTVSGNSGALMADGSVPLTSTWYYGSQTISGTGDFYCNDLYTASGTVYIGDLKLSSSAGKLLINDTPTEISGAPGTAGADGTKWYYGTSVPEYSTGASYDFYFNTSTGDTYIKDAIQNVDMTSDASLSNSTGGVTDLVNAVDGNTGTYTTGGTKCSAYGEANCDIIFDFTTERVITEVKVHTRGYYTCRVFYIQGSNNGSNWTNVSEQQDMVGAIGWWTVDMSSNTTAYRYYRLICTSAGNTFSVSEIEFYGGALGWEQKFNPTVSGGTSDVQTFLDLADTPTTYSGVIGKYLQVTASGIEFATVSGINGTDGDDGTSGLNVYTDYGVPSDSFGEPHEFYVNLNNYDVYKKDSFVYGSIVEGTEYCWHDTYGTTTTFKAFWDSWNIQSDTGVNLDVWDGIDLGSEKTIRRVEIKTSGTGAARVEFSNLSDFSVLEGYAEWTPGGSIVEDSKDFLNPITVRYVRVKIWDRYMSYNYNIDYVALLDTVTATWRKEGNIKGSEWTVSSSDPTVNDGEYFDLWLTETDMEVFVKDEPGWSGDLALNKPAAASEEATGREAEYAVDGNTLTYWRGITNSNKWFQVDLEGGYQINRMTVKNTHYDSIGDFELRASNSSDNSDYEVLLSASHPTDAGTTATYNFLTNTSKYRYYRLNMPYPGVSNQGAISDFELYSNDAYTWRSLGTISGTSGVDGAAGTFLDLTDTPTTYSGSGGKYLRATASGIEFADVPTGSGTLDGALLADGSVPLSGFWDYGSQTISGTGDFYCNDLYTASGTVYIGGLKLSSSNGELLVSDTPVSTAGSFFSVPAGGDTGQVLMKSSGADGTYDWYDYRQLYTASGIPSSALGIETDHYIDLETGDIYQRGPSADDLSDEFISVDGDPPNPTIWDIYASVPTGTSRVCEIRDNTLYTYMYGSTSGAENYWYGVESKTALIGDFVIETFVKTWTWFASGYGGRVVNHFEAAGIGSFRLRYNTTGGYASLESYSGDVIDVLNVASNPYNITLRLERSGTNFYFKYKLDGQSVFTTLSTITSVSTSDAAVRFYSSVYDYNTEGSANWDYYRVISGGVTNPWELKRDNPNSFIELEDTPTTYSGIEGNYLRVTASGIQAVDGIILTASDLSEWLLKVTASGTLYTEAYNG